MTAANRSNQFAKLHKVLKKHYHPVASPPERPVMEHLLYACCLEDARHEAAEEAFAALVHTFFDWNEVRVTSISELSEVMSSLPDPRAAANRIKRVLHGIFEESYSFDMEDKRKKNLGPTVKWLEKIDGTTKFSIAYVVQSALGGHAVPIDAGTMAALRVLDLVDEKDAAQGNVPGMERAISKSKGPEFSSLLHQLGADFAANPYAPRVREILLEIDPEAKDRFPQRRAAKEAEAAPAAKSEATKHEAAKPADAKAAPEAAPRERKKKAEPKVDGHPQAAAAEPAPAEHEKAHAAGKKAPAEPPAAKPAKRAHAPPPADSHKAEPAAAKAGAAKAEPGKRTSPTEGLSKRKPR
jgi:endonuclease III